MSIDRSTSHKPPARFKRSPQGSRMERYLTTLIENLQPQGHVQERLSRCLRRVFVTERSVTWGACSKGQVTQVYIRFCCRWFSKSYERCQIIISRVSIALLSGEDKEVQLIEELYNPRRIVWLFRWADQWDQWQHECGQVIVSIECQEYGACLAAWLHGSRWWPGQSDWGKNERARRPHIILITFSQSFWDSEFLWRIWK